MRARSGLNIDQFKKDMDGEKRRNESIPTMRLAIRSGINVTPTLFINERPMEPQDKNPKVFALRSSGLGEKSQS